MRSFSSSRSLIREWFQRHGFAARLGEYHLRRQWKAIAGAGAASHTRPIKIKFHTLHVAVENSAWLHQLTYRKAGLLQHVQSAMPDAEVRDILFRIGDVTADGDGDDAAAARPARPVSPAARQAAADCARGVRDHALRESLTRVIATALSETARVEDP